MLRNNYLFYSDYIKNRNIKNKSIMIAKTKKSYLVGPIIDSNFYKESFHRRIKSNIVYSHRIYKRLSQRKSNLLINKYKNRLKSNQIIEIYKNGEIILHSILKVPGEYNEKEQTNIK